MDAQVLFDSGKYDLKPEAKATLADVAEIIAGYPGCAVKIEGHTDSQGDDAMNQKLSEHRAVSVERALSASPECKAASFQSAGFGEGRPVAANDTDAGRARNRRVEILIVPKK
jgi:outer membrane protein OmpA-like peptidoglycan-associated protein